MPDHHHDHSHSHSCADEHDYSHDGHDHDLPPGTGIGEDVLYEKIDRANVVALNEAEEGMGQRVIKEWDRREDVEEYLESDADDQLILRVPFTGNIKLRSIILKSGPAGFTPSKMLVYANDLSLDFSDLESGREATQEFEVPITSDVVEFAVKATKFSNVRSLTLFFPGNHSGGDDEETSRVSFVGFKGSWSALTRDPVITVYEAQANPADHKKVQGTAMGMSGLGHGQ